MDRIEVEVRDFKETDAEEVNRIAPAAFEEFAGNYSDWPTMKANLSRMSGLAAESCIIVAEAGSSVIGAVVYVPSVARKAEFYNPDWAVIRMLVVDPEHRGRGAGRLLVEECVKRAHLEKVETLALHTSQLMKVALPMYLRMGFQLLKPAPPLYGVPYNVYVKTIVQTDQ